MKELFKSLAYVLIFSLLAGLLVDFLFNGIAVKVIFRRPFKEEWIIIYGPLFIAFAGTLYTFLEQAGSKFSIYGPPAFLFGALIGHLALVGHHSYWSYDMTLVSKSPYVLLTSENWPQILFLDGDSINRALDQHKLKDQVKVSMEVVTDYGCIRSEIVQTVFNANIRDDRNAGWTWRLNKTAGTREEDGPGMEDLRLPWCRHERELKLIEGGPKFDRPWDNLLEGEKVKIP